MPGKFKRRSRFRRKNKRSLWRQQKLAVGTVKKIAKEVANIQIRKQVEPKYSLLTLGAFGTLSQQSQPVGWLITSRGLYNTVTGAYLNDTTFHPYTALLTAEPPANVGDNQLINSAAGSRIGNSINLTGISLKGYIIYPRTIDAGTVIRANVYHAKHDLDLNLIDYEPSLHCDEIPRELDDVNQVSKVMGKTWILNHRYGGADMKVPVRLYKSFGKAGKRIDYNDIPNTPAECKLVDFKSSRYLLSMTSDVPMPSAGMSVPPTAGQIELFPQFYGQFTAYYRDA